MSTDDTVTRRRRVLQIVRYEGPAVAGWIAHCMIRQSGSAAKVPTDLRWLSDHGLIANANLDPDARADWVLTVEGESYLDDPSGCTTTASRSRTSLNACIDRIERDTARPPRPPHHGGTMLKIAVRALQQIETGDGDAERVAADALNRLSRVVRMR